MWQWLTPSWWHYTWADPAKIMNFYFMFKCNWFWRSIQFWIQRVRRMLRNCVCQNTSWFILKLENWATQQSQCKALHVSLRCNYVHLPSHKFQIFTFSCSRQILLQTVCWWPLNLQNHICTQWSWICCTSSNLSDISNFTADQAGDTD